MSLLKVMTLNIGNPSLQRVQKQIDWLETRDEDVFVLTETKLSQGCLYLEEYFGEVGSTLFDYGKEPKFHVFFPKSQTEDLGVMILSRFPILSTESCFEKSSPYYSRLINVCLDFYGNKVGVMGLYVPSRDSSAEKIKRKKQFVIDYLNYLKQLGGKKEIPYVICGDLNVLEEKHVPHYRNFLKWEYDFYGRFSHFGYTDAFRLLHPTENEYSWVGRTNDGYRYDHCFVSKEISKRVAKCCYIHETRKIPITDHSALTLTLDF